VVLIGRVWDSRRPREVAPLPPGEGLE
jgi:hypothetical protein